MAHLPALFLWIVRKQALVFPQDRLDGLCAAAMHDKRQSTADSDLESGILRG